MRLIVEHLNNALHAKAQANGWASFRTYLQNVRALCPHNVREAIDMRKKKLDDWKDEERAKIVEDLQGKSIEDISDGALPRQAGIDLDYWNYYLEALVDVLDENGLLPQAEK